MKVGSSGASRLLECPTMPRRSRFPACSQCQRLWPVVPPVSRSTSRQLSSRRRQQSSWAAAAAAAIAQHVPSNPTIDGTLRVDAKAGMDPARSMGRETKFLTRNIRRLLGSGHPMLDTVAKYYTKSEGKRIRPLVVLLMSRATSLTPERPRESSPMPSAAWAEELDSPISPARVLSDINPSLLSREYLDRGREEDVREEEAYEIPAADGSEVLPSQRRLAEITELIHTASLLHDDVIDEAAVRRSLPSANIAFGNKMAVLAGDFLLGRASVALARLRDAEVVELLATVIANLVEGEFMQLQNTALEDDTDGNGNHDQKGSGGREDEENHIEGNHVEGNAWAEDALSFYLRKTYLKSASLISKSCRASALLGQCRPDVVDAAYAYGKNLGMAFQLVDDMLDYTIGADELGKPAGADLELGLATAPLLFAWKDHAELGALVHRRFQTPGDVEMVSPPCFL